MTTRLKRILTGSALGGILLVSASAWSMGHQSGHDPERVLRHMTEKLELSDSQHEQIENLLDEGLGSMKEDRARMGELRDQLKAMRTDFDEDKARGIAKELGEVTSRMTYNMASTQSEVYEMLTPAQREKMDEFDAMREKRMASRRAEGKGPEGKRSGGQ